MKITFFFKLMLFIVILGLEARSQTVVKYVSISLDSVLVKRLNESSNSSGGVNRWTDTISENFSFSTGSDFISTASSIESPSISIKLDSLTKQIRSARFGYSWSHDTHDHGWWWHQSESKLVDVSSITASTVVDNDTLLLSLDSLELTRSVVSISHFWTDATTPPVGNSTGSDFQINSVASFEPNSHFTVRIVFGVQSSVLSGNEGKNTISFYINSELKYLGVFRTQQDLSNTLTCYDLLGRKYTLPLESFGSNSDIYSFRSLPRGVYFVVLGKESYKFLVR
jgi:hypothetical protein